jgi:1-deoxy-D-xylulose-5-phosphate reductoisomerase
MPCILNAANEIAVAAFLNDRIGFLEMSDVIADTMATTPFVAAPSLDDYIRTDETARIKAEELITG